jgi:CHAT domain-containing protein/tetratricopeptide (TPR) repeat protein
MQLRPLFFIVLIFFSLSVSAQYYDSLEQVAADLSNKGQFAKSQLLVEEIRNAFPERLSSYILASNNLLNLGRVDEAGGYMDAGLKIDPTSYAMHVNTAYYFLAKGNVETAKQYLTQSIKLFPPNYTLNEALADILAVGKNLMQESKFEELASWFKNSFTSTAERYPTLASALTEFNVTIGQSPTALTVAAQKYATQFADLQWHEMTLAIYGYSSYWLRSYGYYSEALEMAKAGYSYFLKNGYRENSFLASFLLYHLMESYNTLGNYERTIQHIPELTAVSAKLSIHVYDVWALTSAAIAYDRLQKADEAKYMAGIAYQLSDKLGYKYGIVTTANCLLVVNTTNQTAIDANQMTQLGEGARDYAYKYHFDELIASITSNLALSYWKLKTIEGQAKCIQLHGGLAKMYKSKKQFADAALTLNNAGSLFLATGQYDYAANLFEESIALQESNLEQMRFEDKLSFYESQISAYQFLIYCYAKLKNTDKAFATMEASRSRVLAERMAKGKPVTKGSLTDLQKLLQPDEACIMYSLFSGHEVSILLVTKKSLQVIFHSDDSFIGNIKDKYLDRMNKEHNERSGSASEEPVSPDMRVQRFDFNKVTELTRKFFEKPGVADDILSEYLKGYYNFLIAPIANRLAGISKLLISADDVLNYIPFEALKTEDGKYLVETFDVRYFHSVNTLKQLEKRNYQATRRNLLAMGGATFQKMDVRAPKLETQVDLNQLQVEVAEATKNNQSQRRAYGALFGNGPMNALPGTVEEVKNISSVISDADSFVGPDMTENKLKSLSSMGKLANYKVLHLATHGFVVNEIPELSGIAMSIFEKEKDGEDGFMTTTEIANLKLNADLTVLSACQTALGKIYSGEGVTGLTQSLIIAGSNAALVSLWPVNDTSTMLFMSGLYKESSKGKPYTQIVNEMKRRFIKGEFGEQFKHPNYWAPFVYFGK